MATEQKAHSEGLDWIERIYKFWGSHPGLYVAQDALTFLGRSRTIRQRAVEVLELKPGDTVLEIACGTGRNFPYLLEAIGPDGKLVGVDYSQEMLDAASALCQRRGWNNVELLRRDAAHMELDKASFDGVLCALALSAMPGWKETLKVAQRVLKPGGRLSVCDARPFQKYLTALNPLVKRLYIPTTGWDPSRDIIAQIKQQFGTVHVQNFNLGTFFVAWSTAESGS